MKSWHGILVAGALCAMLAGCAGATDASSTTGSSSNPEAAASAPAASEALASSSVESNAQSSMASGAASEPAQDIAGRWDTVEMSQGGETIVVADLPEDRRALAAQQYWVFKADGTLDMVDESQDFTQTCNWELDGSTMSLTFEGAPMMTAEYDGTNIVVESDGIVMKLQKSA